ncbi:glycosyltransferase [Ruficoccus amylovorans]|uniref:Glycosyltransferase n=1 Tax=Ruficoccus amylovorans TaxID=1804625 RepID=A0A842HE60_9BACT|nr:glycosyltransferase [Ruficoccus amylovorans]
MKNFSLGLIVNTYRNPRALDKVLAAIHGGTELPHEVILAEDDEDAATAAVAADWRDRLGCPLVHCSQADKGYRRSRILNLAIARATSDYLVFIDGDCIPGKRFVADHKGLAREGCFVQGRRTFLDEKSVPAFLDGRASARKLFWTGKISGRFKAIRLPVPKIKRNRELHGVLGCNLGLWREDLLAVNGYDESFEGWGAEDSDLAARLYHLGRDRLLVHGRAVLLHLNHPFLPRDDYAANKARLQQTLDSGRIRCEHGVDAHR